MKKYLINISMTFGFILINSLIINLFYYFNIISNSLYNIIITITNSLIVGIFSYLLGKKAEKKGYIEGLKFGVIISVIMFIGSLILKNINVYMIIYYLILILISTIGGMLGINKKKN